MAFTTIAKPSDYFDCPIWDGSASTTTITGMGFKPDALWIKRYEGTSGLPVFNNSTQGTALNWIPSTSNAMDTTVYVASYTSDGFTLTGNVNNTNAASQKYMAACWKANGGTTASNSDGSITSTVQADTTSGVSIVKYTGTGSNATVGHGLGIAPKILWVKHRTVADYGALGVGGTTLISDSWTDYKEACNFSSGLADNVAFWNDTEPTTTVFSVGTFDHVNKASTEFIAYCFAEVQGFSKMGFYSGTGNVAGTKVYCGFRPKYIMVRNADDTEDWAVKVSGLDGYGLGGERTQTLKYNSGSTTTNCTINFESNGFRLTTTDGKANGSNVKYFYMAFAEMPMVGTNGTIALAT